MESIERAKFFQDVHLWPLSEDLNYKGWLGNFSLDEQEIAHRLLDFFLYYNEKMIDKMLQTSIECAGNWLSKNSNGWKHNHFFNRCLYSYIPGESPNPTDSGLLFSRKLRDTLSIPEVQIINFTEIPDRISEAKEPVPIILVDDFVGSGAQCDKAWNHNRLGYSGKTLKEISAKDGHYFIYAPLIVNYKGFTRLKSSCKDLILTPAHTIGAEYNLFRRECICWKDEVGSFDLEMFTKGTQLIIDKSHELGIPFSNGESVIDVRGFCEQGLSFAFSHGAPDAILPLFYWQEEGWTPLIKKNYERL